MPDYLMEGRGLSEEAMKSRAALPFIFGIGGNLAGGYLSDRLARKYGLRIGRRLVGAGSLALAASLFLFAATTVSATAAALGLALAYGVMDCMLPTAWAFCLDVGGRHAGAVTATMNTAVQAGCFLCTVTAGYLVHHFRDYQIPLFVIAGMLLLSSVLFAQLDPTRPLLPAADTPTPEKAACA
jgi:predicted MFS family arabinose efflux permease